MLMNLKIADWPYYKQNAREKTLKKLNREAYPASFKEAKELTHDGLAKILRG